MNQQSADEKRVDVFLALFFDFLSLNVGLLLAYAIGSVPQKAGWSVVAKVWPIHYHPRASLFQLGVVRAATLSETLSTKLCVVSPPPFCTKREISRACSSLMVSGTLTQVWSLGPGCTKMLEQDKDHRTQWAKWHMHCSWWLCYVACVCVG